MRVALVAVLFFLSGLTGLVYEVIWSRYLALLLGSTAHAQVGVLAVFMAGLALGSALWGTAADRSPRPLRLYGVLEIVVGLSTAGFALGFSLWSQLYWSALAAFPPPHWMARVTQVVLCVFAMAIPTICMGGTLPVLVRALGLTRTGFGRGVAFLYAINSFGAASGAAAAGFVLIPQWGLDAPFVAASVANVLVGLAAIVLDRMGPALAEERATPSEPAHDAARDAGEGAWIRGYRWLIPLAAGVSGAAAMTYEVVWIRLCGLVSGSSTYAFSIMLTAFILGIASGGLVYTLWAPARARPLRFYIAASLTSAAVLLACMPFYERLPFLAGRLVWVARQQGWDFAGYQLANLGFWVAVMFPLTFVSGLTFPALAHAAAQVLPGRGRPVGAVLAANTLGTIVGTVAAGLYLLPWLGMQGTFYVAAGTTVGMALALLAADRRSSLLQIVASTVGVALAAVLYGALVPGWDLRLLVSGEFRRHEGIGPDLSFAAYKGTVEQTLLYYRDGATGTVSVEQTSDDVILRVNGKSDASAFGDRETQLMLGHLGPVVLGSVRRVLVIGYGSGMTLGAIARHPVEAIDVVEISPEVLEASEFFRAWVHRVDKDPRVRVYIEDARTFLFRTPHRYDLIVSEPSNPWVAGVSNLFTREFFSQARARLTPHGALVQWFHSYETSDDVVRLVVRSAIEQFPDVRLFQSNQVDFFLLASMAPRQLDPEAARQAFAHATDFASLGITHWETFAALELAQRPGLQKLAGRGPVHTDRRPLLDYWAARAFYAGTEASAIREMSFKDNDNPLLPPARMPVAALREWAQYQQRLGSFGQLSTVRFLASWLRQDPLDPALHRAGGEFLRKHERYLVPFQELVAVAAEPGPERTRRMRGLLAILRAGPQPPNERFLALLEPLLADLPAAEETEIELELAELYLAARGYAQALALLDRSEGLRVMASRDEATRRACIRAAALDGLDRNEEAKAAFARCRLTAR